MQVNIARLRRWIAAAAIALVVLVAGVYFYGRWRIRRAIREAPQKLGLEIQQSTEGFSISKSEGGRTIFKVRASKAVQYKPGGRAELHDVQILVYGRESNRYDQIYGQQFEYNPQSGDVAARGEVRIDLEGNAEGPLEPDQAVPSELKNPIHVKTSGLVFNSKTGIANTDEAIEFSTPQAQGSARGATYDSRAATLTLHSDIRVQQGGPDSATITASHGLITRAPVRAVLSSVRMVRGGNDLRTDQLTVYLRDNNSIERVLAEGNVRASGAGGKEASVRAQRAVAWVSPSGTMQTAEFSGDVQMTAGGKTNMNGSAGRVQLAFIGKNIVDKITATDHVQLIQMASDAKQTAGQPLQPKLQITAATVNFQIANGRQLRQAVTSGPAEIVMPEAMSGSATGAAKTVATAGVFTANFENNHLRRVSGSPDAKVVSYTPGQPEKTSSSKLLLVTFDPQGSIAEIEQSGSFEYREAGGADATKPSRTAFAEKASYLPSKDSLVLTGSPRFVEGGFTTTANTIALQRRSQQATAEGDVKTTYSQLEQRPNGALLATSDPIHVTAARMVAAQAGGTATFYGSQAGSSENHSAAGANARLWQGANMVQAPVIEFNRDRRRLIASGGAQTPDSQQPVSTTFTQRDKSGKTTAVTVSAGKLDYSDSERRARFDGGVQVRAAEVNLKARQVDVLLQPKGQNAVLNKSSSDGDASAKAGGPESNQLDRIVATGNLIIEQGARRATGEKLVYLAEDGSFTLTGGSPSIFDAEHGEIRGTSLTFFSRNDRVLVEGSKSSPTTTQTRVAK